MIERRNFLKSIAVVTGATALTPGNLYSKPACAPELVIACQQYTWFTYFKREQKSWMENPDKSFTAYLESGFTRYEPSFNQPSEVAKLKAFLDEYKIGSKSMYVNSVLHEPQLVEKNMADIIAIAKEAKRIGIEILVTNPTPIKWGGQENKSDEQLKAQAIALNLLGKELKSLGIKLAYHNHDAEMREGAREFHHMLTGTDPAYVHLCLDAHWIYRGAGNSQVALFDIVALYADRIVELHLRQSQDNIWSEVFGDGDIDYQRLADMIRKLKLKPHLVMEQAVEEGTPNTMGTVEALSKSLLNAKEVFKNFV
jgi:inosose dehydratase